MNRAWKNEAGFRLVLLVGARWYRVTLYKGTDVVLNLGFEYWEQNRAERAADTLAEYGHMQEVPSGLRQRA